MGHAAVNELLYLLDLGFEGNPEHSLIANLDSVTEADWRRKPDGGGRSIRNIVMHAGVAKYVYADFAFGQATLQWDRAMREAAAGAETLVEARVWLAAGHAILRAGVASLGDEDLVQRRPVHYGLPEVARTVIATMVQHDLYHAGEINHLRALLQGTDAWPGQQAKRAGEPR
ncbi:MAG TPA: DinB family protein [Dehalococcoidia bacterium]|jgi:hypothetical protein